MRIQRRFMLGIGATVVMSSLAGFGAARYLQPAAVGADAYSEHAADSTGDTHQALAATANPSAFKLTKLEPGKVRYTCPMHPQVIQDKPGNCPFCGMHLVKMQEGKAAQSAATSTLAQGAPASYMDAATEQRMGVRFATAEINDMHRPVDAFATITYDESHAVSVNPKVEGWIKKLHVRGVGQMVRKGQVLYEIYSPELQQRQRDYVDLLTRRDGLLDGGMGAGGPNAAMLGSLAKERFRARDRLLAADLPLTVLEKLEKDRRVADVVPVLAGQDGIVTALSAREGSYINPAQTILSYADSSKVWAEVTVFPEQLNWIKNGDAIVLTSGLDAGARIRAKVDLSTVQIDPANRTAKLRLALDNSRGAFRPGAFAEASIYAQAHRALSVPRDAVIRTGHGDFVVTSEGNGHFRSTEVRLGMDDARNIEIVSGLRAGDKVAINGQFLLDSASSIAAMQNRLSPAAASGGDEPTHAPHESNEDHMHMSAASGSIPV